MEDKTQHEKSKPLDSRQNHAGMTKLKASGLLGGVYPAIGIS
jgi:hypothetical protein